MISAACVGIAIVLLAFASLRDVIARSVPNAVAGVLAADGLAMQIVARHILFSVLAALVVFAIAVGLWLRGVMGGADVKLLAAAALLVRPSSVGLLVLAIAIAGGLLGLFYVLASFVARRHSAAPSRDPAWRSLRAVSRVLRIERYRMSRGFPVPYAVAIAGGTAFVFGQGLAG